MSVVCDVCRTSNLDSAMFCDGCGSALRGLAPTGLSAMEWSKGPRLNGWPTSDRAPLTAEGQPGRKSIGLGTRLGLLALAIGAAFVAGLLLLQRAHIT